MLKVTAAAPTIRPARPENTGHVRRIAITVDPEIPVPPVLYGGIERMVELLVEQYTAWGAEVLLFAHPDSSVQGQLAPYPALSSNGLGNTLKNMALVTSEVASWRPQVIHSFGRLAYLLPLLPWPLPKVMSYQREISPQSIVQAERLSRGTVSFTACSRHLMADYANRPNWSAIYNAVSPERYQFVAHVGTDAPLVFLGRLEEIKGPHLAIEIAKRSGRKLILAGNVPNTGQAQAFFRDRVEPHIDGRDVEYVGPVNDAEKNDLLGSAAALLMPILWNEPFGIVMAESLACGTPVVGLNRGSVPEVVEPGRTGFVGDTLEDLVRMIPRLSELARSACRQAMEQRFSQRAMAGEYLRLYARLVRLGRSA